MGYKEREREKEEERKVVKSLKKKAWLQERLLGAGLPVVSKIQLIDLFNRIKCPCPQLSLGDEMSSELGVKRELLKSTCFGTKVEVVEPASRPIRGNNYPIVFPSSAVAF
jgi:hypothetical protein